MPGYCKPGRFDALVGVKLDEMRQKRQKINDIRSRVDRAPYYEVMPTHFQNYERKKEQKQQQLQERSLEDIDPNCTFKPAINPKKFGMDFKKYFSELQFKFGEELAEKKLNIRKSLDKQSSKFRSSHFHSSFDKRKSKHVCSYVSQTAFKPSTKPISLFRPQEPVLPKKHSCTIRCDEIIAEAPVKPVRHQRCFAALNDTDELPEMVEIERGIIQNPHSLHESLAAKQKAAAQKPGIDF